MSVSTSVRMALAKGNKRQVELAELLGFTRQAVNLKLAKERWTGAELARVAAFTGGKLAFVYPDGQEILVDLPEGNGKRAKPARQPAGAEKTPKQKAAEKPAKPKTAANPGTSKAAAGKAEKKTAASSGRKAKKPAGSGKEKQPVMKEEQLSFFG